ncbi:glycosyltransferase [Chloroflexota bacterium]
MSSRNNDNIRFSVIIPTFNRSEILRQAVEALCNQEEPGCAYEIVVADNDSTDNTREIVEELARQCNVPIRYVVEKQRGSAFARNAGFKVGMGEILGLIDDDVIVDSTWVKNIVKVYDNPEVSCAGGKLTVKWINGSPPKWIEPFRGVLGEIDLGDEPGEIPYPQTIVAGNFSIRKDILLKVGGYNPCNASTDVPIGDGESGLCQKVYDSGGHIYWVPEATALHLQDSTRVTPRFMWRRGKFQGMSSAYTIYRRARGNLFKVSKDVCRDTIHRMRRIFFTVTMLRHRKSWGAGINKLFWEFQYFPGMYLYLFKIYTDKQLRELVTRDDWIND